MNHYQISDPDLMDDRFKIMYCGSVRTANDIGTIVSCAKSLNNNGYEKRFHVIIYGDGPDKEILEKRCEEEGIPNVTFKGAIDKKYIPYVLSQSDLNVLNLKPAGTQKYGNSSNKLFEYFAAGNPVIANIDEGKYPIISKYKCGKIVKAGSVEDYVKGIEYFINLNDDELAFYKANALQTAKLFDTEVINENWKNVVDRCLNKL